MKEEVRIITTSLKLELKKDEEENEFRGVAFSELTVIMNGQTDIVI